MHYVQVIDSFHKDAASMVALLIWVILELILKVWTSGFICLLALVYLGGGHVQSLSSSGQNCLMFSYKYHCLSNDNPIGVIIYLVIHLGRVTSHPSEVLYEYLQVSNRFLHHTLLSFTTLVSFTTLFSLITTTPG